MISDREDGMGHNKRYSTKIKVSHILNYVKVIMKILQSEFD